MPAVGEGLRVKSIDRVEQIYVGIFDYSECRHRMQASPDCRYAEREFSFN
jgi:hypothetical protein